MKLHIYNSWTREEVKTRTSATRRKHYFRASSMAGTYRTELVVTVNIHDGVAFLVHTELKDLSTNARCWVVDNCVVYCTAGQIAVMDLYAHALGWLGEEYNFKVVDA